MSGRVALRQELRRWVGVPVGPGREAARGAPCRQTSASASEFRPMLESVLLFGGKGGQCTSVGRPEAGALETGLCRGGRERLSFKLTAGSGRDTFGQLIQIQFLPPTLYFPENLMKTLVLPPKHSCHYLTVVTCDLVMCHKRCVFCFLPPSLRCSWIFPFGILVHK